MVGPVAVVTGAGSGIGRHIAWSLLAAGFRVVLVGRRSASLEQTVADRPRSGPGPGDGEALVVAADVSVEADVERLFQRTWDAWGRVDLLVNNAGTFGPSGAVDEVDADAWRQTLDVNVTGAFLCAQHAVRMMKRQQPPGGRIINNGSISAHTPRPASVAYTVSKHAITGLTKSINLDGRDHDIACGQIDIGNASTEMTAALSVSARQPDGSSRPEPTFDPRHVADIVVQMAQLPLGVNVPFMTVMATAMPYAGRG